MAKPNYSFEKRQRELAKKKKKEVKEKERADRKTGPGADDNGVASAESPDSNPKPVDATSMGPPAG